MTLEEKKNSLINNMKENLTLIKKQEELIKKEKDYCLDKIEAINNYEYFTKEEAKEIIEYLVSKIENKKYYVRKHNMENISSNNYTNNDVVFEFSLLYLVSEDKEEQAINEIKSKYEKNNNMNREMINSEDISDNYTRLAIYNRHSGRKVKFGKEKENHVISIDIKDERFNYIYNFIDEVLNEKLDRYNNPININTIKNIADNFALNYKQAKILKF